MLDVARIVNGTLSLEPRATDLAQVVEKALDAVHPAAAAKSISVEADLVQPLEMAAGDPDRLQQIISNLLSNAVKFTPNDGRIAVRLAREGAEALLTVEDSGCGIAPSFLPYVFERFRQGEGEGGQRQAGLGLGLAIARHLVERHGGTIRVASDGEGCGPPSRSGWR